MTYRSPRPWLVALAAAPLACTNPIELETDSAESGNMTAPSGPMSGPTSGSSGPTTVDPDDTGSTLPTERQVDILFVVDNTGSMGDEQGLMVQGVNALLDALDGANPPVGYRIGVTTTDNGNPWCAGTGPEAGSLRATSCRSRPTEFVFEGAQTIDAYAVACENVCALDSFTITDAKPWIEVDGLAGTANVAVDQVRDAIRCMLPQGIDGCGFESQLESAWKAVRRFDTDDDASFGFHRDGALLVILFITDEADCSYNNDWETIFLPEGNRVFWSDPDAPAPSSAVCWNAGVACIGSGIYEDCMPVDLDADGNELPATSADDLAVLRPVERYTEEFSAVGAYVAAINGVNADGTVTYADSVADPVYQSDFGIGPGCESGETRAVPPVRLRAVIDEVNSDPEPAMFSICNANYSSTFESLASRILTRLP
ncbi:MAG: hypothetical protein KDK70_11845 [Myxococcales bacterium]|nr:hypothetical protein [Myxococcales bacterium]